MDDPFDTGNNAVNQQRDRFAHALARSFLLGSNERQAEAYAPEWFDEEIEKEAPKRIATAYTVLMSSEGDLTERIARTLARAYQEGLGTAEDKISSAVEAYWSAYEGAAKEVIDGPE